MSYFNNNVMTAKVKKLLITDWIVVRVKRRSMPGYDVLGNLAIVDFEGIPKGRQQGIAQRILDGHKNVATILAKAGPVTGKFRTRKLRYVLGKRNYIADYRENNCRFVFDVRKSFFSNRLSFERNRIASMSKGKENVLVMFAGVGPFAIEIAKSNPKANVVAIELNKHAYLAMKKNIELNKTRNVIPVYGDVKKLARKYAGFADRIVMPLPWESMNFLDDAVIAAKRKATLHVYTFTDREGGRELVTSLLKAHAEAHNYKATVEGTRVVREYSATEVEMVADVKIKK